MDLQNKIEQMEHDLRGQLSIISIYTQLLKKTLVPYNETQDEYLTNIKNAYENSLKMIDTFSLEAKTGIKKNLPA